VSVLDKPQTHLAAAEALIREIRSSPNVFLPDWYANELLAVARLFDASPADPLLARAFRAVSAVMRGGRTVDWDADVAALVRRVRRTG
jgi:hypothetical protein